MAHFYQHLMLSGAPSVQAATITGHLVHRIELGAAVVICQDPKSMSLNLAKTWQKHMQSIKQLRDQTTDTDEKLRLTHRLIKLQSTRIGTSPFSQVLICSTDQPQVPPTTKTIYITSNADTNALSRILTKTTHTLLVGSLSQSMIQKLGLQPKASLDEQAEQAWKDLLTFIRHHQISLSELTSPHPERFGHINTALENLLDEHAARQFVSLMNDFHILARQAMPLLWSHQRIRQQQTLAVLASQVATYTPGLTTQSLADNEDPLFYLSDHQFKATETFWNQICPEQSFWNDLGKPVHFAAGLV